MKVKEVMTKNVFYAEVPGNRTDVLKEMLKHGVSGMPVVKARTKELVGIITRKDIFKKPDIEQLALLMTKNPITISPKDDVNNAIKIFLEKKIHRLPVVEKGNLVGIITPMDILSIIEKKEISTPIENFITEICVPVHYNTPINVIAEIMNITGIYSLPVLNSSARVVGIITDNDLFKSVSVDKKFIKSTLGLGNDEDIWNLDGMRSIVKLYYEVSHIELPKTPIKEIMVRNVITVSEKICVFKVAREMRKNDIGQIPVVDAKEKLKGIVYDVDLLRAL